MPIATPPFVKGLQVLRSIFIASAELPELDEDHVFTKLQDGMGEHLPALIVERTGGSSDRPEFVSDYFTHLQVWSGETADFPNDPFGAAFDLSQRVAKVLYEACKNQTVAYDGNGHVLGWISQWRESSGFQDATDVDLPDVGRYVATYDLKIRNRRPNSI